MNLRTALAIFVICSFIAVRSCGDDPENNPGNIVNIENDINEVTTWSGDSIYIIGAWDFYVNNTLTIEPGTIIKFTTDGPDMTLGSGGTIVANGTSDMPIVFTSWKDDEHGGDSNGDSDATMPAVSDWGGINTADLNGSVFNYCEFYYGGNTTYSATLVVYGNNIKVTNCTFAFNAGDDPSGWYGALDAIYAEGACIINNNTFYDNTRPFSVGVEFSIDNSNRFSHPDDPARTNTYNGIFVETLNEVNTAITWSETEVPFVIEDNDWWINSGASLTLGNDVCLKFRPGSAMVLNDSDAIINYDGTGVLFTSYKDDDAKGDTNGDGTATSPGPGDWEGIYDNITGDYVSWPNIKYNTIAN